jgi:hypothetical protein
MSVYLIEHAPVCISIRWVGVIDLGTEVCIYCGLEVVVVQCTRTDTLIVNADDIFPSPRAGQPASPPPACLPPTCMGKNVNTCNVFFF